MRPIPGFYYDTEKKKYFKIQPGHTPQSQSEPKYTNAEINKRETQSKKKRQKVAHHERTRLERVKRTKMLYSPMLGVLGVEQEAGRCRVPSKDTLSQRAMTCASLMERRELVNLSRRGRQYCHEFARDPKTGIILTALKATSTSNFSAFRPLSSKRPWKYDERVDDGIIELNHCDWVGSVAINTDRYALVVSQGLLSGKGTEFAVCKLIEPDEIYGRSSRSVFQNYSVFKRKNASFCSAVAYPGAHSCSFIIGHGNELTVVSSAHGMHSMGRFNVYPADIMAVDWISNSEVIVGLRNSAVALTDWRCAASTTRLVHSHGVKKLKMVGESKVLVAGFDNTLDMYDLRFTRAAAQRHLDPNSRSHRSSTPYLRFGEINYSTLNDLDVSAELGLAACATDLSTVQLYSLYTGKLLEASATYPSSPRCAGGLLSRNYLNPIDCVRFETVVEPYEYGKSTQTSDGRNNTRSTSLLVGSSEIIEEWSM